MLKQNKSDAYQRGENTASAVGSYRRYSVLVMILEVFLRKSDMGDRYFNGRSFLGGLVGLVVLRFFQSMSRSTVIGDLSFSPTYFFDGFILLYLLLSLVHFIYQWRHRFRFQDRLSEHSYYVGTSRLLFIARALRLRHAGEATLYAVEPLMVLLLAIPIAMHSVFLGIITALAAIRLWWENSKVLNEERQRELDRLDNQKYGRFVQRHTRYTEPLKTLRKPHHSPLKANKETDSSVSSPSDLPSPPSVEEAFERLSPRLKNLGKSKQ